MQEDYLKVINEQGKTENVKVANINKKISKMGANKALSRDSKGNSLAVNHMVKCTNGEFKVSYIYLILLIYIHLLTFIFLVNFCLIELNQI